MSLAAAAPAHGGTRQQCLLASEHGQDLRDTGRLLAAREQFIACAREACPALVRAECARWLAAVEERTPSIVLRAKDREGRDLSEVFMTIDGQPLARSPEGRSLPLDPGAHAITVQREGFVPAEVRLVAREGERNRMVDVALDPARSAAAAGDTRTDTGSRAPERPSASPPAVETAPAGRRPFPVTATALAAAGLAGIGAFVGLGLSARADIEHLRQSCAPACGQAPIDRAHRKALAANVSLGVGVLALGASAWLLLHRPAPEPAVLRFELTPLSAGARCSIEGRF